MKAIAFICTLALCMSVCAQQSKEEIIQVGEHVYKKCYFYDLISIARIPKDTIPRNQDTWKEYYYTHSIGAEPKEIIDRNASPFISKGEADITLSLIHNLQGELIYVEYIYQQAYDVIPIEIIDKIDTELKETVKISVEQHRKDPEKKIHNIALTIFVSAGSKGNE